jgi:hypothetical protein
MSEVKGMMPKSVLAKSHSESNLLPPRHFIRRVHLDKPEGEAPAQDSHLESPSEYFTQTRQWAQTQSKKWVDRIFQKEAEQDRVWADTADFVLVADKGWTSQKADDLHLLAIFKRDDLLSIRDLKDGDAELLKSASQLGCKMIKEKYGLGVDQLKMYFHYYPSTWQLHIHFVNLSYRSNSSIEQAHNFHYVVQNLELGISYYSRVVLQTKYNPSVNQHTNLVLTQKL